MTRKPGFRAPYRLEHECWLMFEILRCAIFSWSIFRLVNIWNCMGRDMHLVSV